MGFNPLMFVFFMMGVIAKVATERWIAVRYGVGSEAQKIRSIVNLIIVLVVVVTILISLVSIMK